MINVPMPEISPAFTIVDIHKIREWHYEMQKGMTVAEICEYIRKEAEFVESRLKEPVDPAIHAEVNRLLQSVKKSEKVLA